MMESVVETVKAPRRVKNIAMDDIESEFMKRSGKQNNSDDALQWRGLKMLGSIREIKVCGEEHGRKKNEDLVEEDNG